MYLITTRVNNLMSSYRDNGLAPRVHGNKHRLPKNTLSREDSRNIVVCLILLSLLLYISIAMISLYIIQVFLTNYSEMHGLLLPGHVPGYSRTDIKLLPSSVSKRGIWKVYRDAMIESNKRAAAYCTFC